MGGRATVEPGEKFNAITHLVGTALTGVGFLVLVVPPLVEGDFKKAIGLAVYGASLFLTFLVSTLFHSTHGGTRDWFRRLDRTAIYLLIAGTYTPITLLKLPAEWGRPLLSIVWVLALSGSMIELLSARGKKPLSVALYFAMGWMSLLAIKPLLAALTPRGVLVLVAGGVLYTLGGIALRMKLIPRSHEVWHVLSLAGGACHFAVILFYVS